MNTFLMTLVISLLAFTLTACGGNAVDYSTDPAFAQGRADCQMQNVTGHIPSSDVTNPAYAAGWVSCTQQN